MAQVFLSIVNMSISASYIVLAVLLLRLLLRKAPRWIAVVLWGIVAIRLVCPFSIESALSLIPSGETVSPTIMTDSVPTINTGIPVINSTVNPIISESLTPGSGTSANPLQIWIPILTIVWVLGVAALVIYAAVSYARVRLKVGTAVVLHGSIYQSENVISPFVLGVIKPKIYLPISIDEKDAEHVIAHETAHIRRKDHIWKPLGFLLLALHWFNPLMWLGYILLCRDIELACDEKVIKALDHDARADYSQALLTCSVNRRMIAACPLAFGEVGVKNRVKSVLHYKKPAFWIIVVAVVACAVVAVCFLTNPKTEDPAETVPQMANPAPNDPNKLDPSYFRALMESYPEYFGLDASNGLDVYVWQMARSLYSFGVLPHSEQDRTHVELMALEGVNAVEMRAILSTYSLDMSKIYIIPWQNPVSSYLPSWSIVTEGEDVSEKVRDYVKRIREMLFGEQVVRNGIYGTYVRQNEGDPIPFTITLNENGTYMYYVGSLSSHIGMGDYTYENGIVTLVDTQIPGVYGSLTHTYKFLEQDGNLYFMAEESDQFMYKSLPDAAEFVYADPENLPFVPVIKEP